MRLRFAFISTVYSILQASTGLFLHPYQTMQQLVEEKIFLWLVGTPLVGFGIFAGIWWLSLQLFFTNLPYIGAWAFVLLWGSIFFFSWQVLLLYLLIRFLKTLSR